MGKIHSIETFGTVDGPGIRYVVFFAGCPMRCKYCHNPDTWDIAVGKEMTADEVLSRLLRNKMFYTTGGITATGGEPTLQLSFLTELFTLAKQNGIHTCLDTSGILFDGSAAYDRLMAVTDLVMLDIKHSEEQGHKSLTGCSGKNPRAFLSYLQNIGKATRIRHVLVPGITDEKAQLEGLRELILAHDNILQTEILPYHTLGEHKYQKLGIEYPLKGIPQATPEQANAAYHLMFEQK